MNIRYSEVCETAQKGSGTSPKSKLDYMCVCVCVYTHTYM